MLRIRPSAVEKNWSMTTDIGTMPPISGISDRMAL